MKRITLSLALLILLVILYSNPVSSQDYKLIDLKSTTIVAPTLEYYVLDVFDSRELKTSIGITKSGNKDEIVMLNFFQTFHDELMYYFNQNFPASEGNISIMLNIKRLWITEYEKDGTPYSKCEIEMEFLTPKKQKFYDCNEKNEIQLSTTQNVLQENIIECLNNCMLHLKDPKIKKTYYSILNSSTPGIRSLDNTDIQEHSVTGSKNKIVSTGPQGRITVQGGFTHRLGRIPESNDQEITDHYKRLKNGFHIGTDLSYFVSEKNGFGASASFSQAISTLANMQGIDEMGNVIATGDLTENVKLIYLGPSYFNRIISTKNNTHMLYGLTMGYYAYNEQLSWLGETVLITGGTVGFGVSIGVDILTSDHFAIGLQGSLYAGWLNKVRVDGDLVELQESENLSRLDITIGFRFLP